MGLKDPHDDRTFTHFEKLDAGGHVVAVVEVADGALADAIVREQHKRQQRSDARPVKTEDALTADHPGFTFRDITATVRVAKASRGR